MPLTSMRWRLTLIACCAVALFVALRSTKEPVQRFGRFALDRSREERLHAVAAAIEQTADEYVRDRWISVFDSVSRANPMAALDSVSMDRRDVDRALSIIAVDTVGRVALPAVRQMAERELAALTAIRVPIRIVVMQSPRERFSRLMARKAGDAAFSRVVQLPTAPGGACTLLLTARIADREQLASTLAASDGVLGPCAFLAQFGFPGRALRAHIDSVRWHTAAFARWSERPDSGEPPRPPWSDLTRDGVRCLVRGDDACARAWRATPEPSRWEYDLQSENPRLDDRGLTGPLPWYAVHGASFGMRQRLFFSDLVREVGPERFAGFWRSDAPVDSAFTRLLGMHEREWTARWLARAYERYTPSPAPSRAGVAWWVLVFIAIGVSLWGVQTRRTT